MTQAREVLVRGAALLAALAYLAIPLASVAQNADVPVALRAALGALLAIGIWRPHWSPSLLLVLVPLLPVWPTLTPAIPPSIVHLVVATQVAPWFVRRALGRTTTETCPAVPGMALFVLVAVVSTLVQLAPVSWDPTSLARTRDELGTFRYAYLFGPETTIAHGTIRLLSGLLDGLACMLLARGVVTPETRGRVARAAVVGAVATALFGFVQAQTQIGLQSQWRLFDAGITRINATFVDPNALAAFYALVVPIGLGLALAERGRRRIAWLGAVGVIVVAVVMTAGRAGLLALTMGCAVLVWMGLARRLDAVDPWPFIRKRGRTLAKGTLALGVGTLALFVTVGTVLDVRHEHQTSYLHTWLYTFNLRQPPDAIAKGRLAVWKVATAMTREAPVHGVGLGESIHEFERYRAQLGIDSLPEDAKLSAHNTYLFVASELGMFGLAAWLLLIVALVIGVRAAGLLPAGQPSTWLGVGLAAGLAGYTFTMLTGDRILLREEIVVSATCAAIATLGSGRLPRWWRLTATVLAVLVVVSLPLRVHGRMSAFRAQEIPPHEGLYPDEIGRDDKPYRWTQAYAVLFVPADATRVELPLRNLSPDAQQVEVFVDGRLADRQVLESGPWVTVEYRLPPVKERWHRIALHVSPTWQVPGDTRVRGVIIGDWSYQPR